MNLRGNVEDLIIQAARDLVKAGNAVALTGAGISIESGIPPFRGKGGLWERIDPMLAHIDTFLNDPEKVWRILMGEMKDVIDRARPNDAHLSLYRLEAQGILKTIITQNVDGLHQMAGSQDVIEFHGNFAWQRCMACDRRCETRDVDMTQIPPRCGCGGIYRPDCVFFGEPIPEQHLRRSRQAAEGCAVMLVVGTSAIIHPACFMPVIATESGATVIEINPEPTPLTGSVSNYLIRGPAGPVLSRIADEIEKIKKDEHP